MGRTEREDVVPSSIVSAPSLVARQLVGWWAGEGKRERFHLARESRGSSFPIPAPSIVEQRSGKAHPLGFPRMDRQDRSTVKPQISSEGSGKGQELGYCVTVGSVRRLSWDMFVYLDFLLFFFFFKL